MNGEIILKAMTIMTTISYNDDILSKRKLPSNFSAGGPNPFNLTKLSCIMNKVVE